ncbi:MAG: hypothetical protein ACKOJF_22885 [Planctomycetaceae bacterium]
MALEPCGDRPAGATAKPCGRRVCRLDHAQSAGFDGTKPIEVLAEEVIAYLKSKGLI